MRRAEWWQKNELKTRMWEINLNVPPMVLHIHINIAWLLLTSEFIGFPPSQIRGPSIDEYFSTCALCGTFIISFAIINRINEQSKSNAAAARHTAPLRSLIFSLPQLLRLNSLKSLCLCCLLYMSARSHSKYAWGLRCVVNKYIGSADFDKRSS